MSDNIGRKARTAKEVSDAFRSESPENERLYQESAAKHTEATFDEKMQERLNRLKMGRHPNFLFASELRRWILGEKP